MPVRPSSIPLYLSRHRQSVNTKQGPCSNLRDIRRFVLVPSLLYLSRHRQSGDTKEGPCSNPGDNGIFESGGSTTTHSYIVRPSVRTNLVGTEREDVVPSPSEHQRERSIRKSHNSLFTPVRPCSIPLYLSRHRQSVDTKEGPSSNLWDIRWFVLVPSLCT